ncbi:hypothetical protein JOD01_001543 [Brevibacillus fulvus]|uniref:Uncharacterized protein n=1 Tax=Brevibacillus fulvus TaxID=1125967 RepID=A0A938XTR4_9BACL|nr:hypothetical protein [Brevibacillus fulvus]
MVVCNSLAVTSNQSLIGDAAGTEMDWMNVTGHFPNFHSHSARRYKFRLPVNFCRP